MQEEKATYAMLVGIPKASKELNITPELLTRWIKLMNFQDSKLFRRLREKILERAMKKNARNAARHFGLTENIVVEMLKEYLSDEANDPENTIYPHNTYDRFAQTCNYIQQPNWKHIGVQTESMSEPQPTKYMKDNDEKRIGKKYGIAEKVAAVRQFLKGSTQAAASRELNIPTASLLRWKDKIKNNLFQEMHVDNLYGSSKSHKKDKLFFELDETLFNWYDANKDKIQDIDTELKNKAMKIAKIDDKEPVISEKWLSSFKEHYKINSSKKKS